MLHAFLMYALDGGKWSASHPCRFTFQGKSPWYLFDRRLDGPQSRSGHGVEKVHFCRVDKREIGTLRFVFSVSFCPLKRKVCFRGKHKNLASVPFVSESEPVTVLP
jgi:hypothetical protein